MLGLADGLLPTALYKHFISYSCGLASDVLEGHCRGHHRAAASLVLARAAEGVEGGVSRVAA